MKKILIIGGGFSGATTAIELLSQTKEPLEIFLSDSRGSVGQGLAYQSNQLLNLPASQLGLYPDKPEHFYHWLLSKEVVWRKEFPKLVIHASAFLPRKLYGIYIHAELKKAAGKSYGRIHFIQEEIEDLLPAGGQWQALAKSGNKIPIVDAVVLALGNFPKKLPMIHTNVLDGLRDTDKIKMIPKKAEVAILGSRLTAIDTIQSLLAQGFKGKLSIISKHGKMPLLDKKYNLSYALEISPKILQARKLKFIFREVRAELKKYAAQGIDWRVYVDELAKHSSQIWKNLPHQERLRFLRHLRFYWELHCQRSPYEELALNKNMEIKAARAVDFLEAGDRIQLFYKERSRNVIGTLTVDYIISCMGLEFDLDKLDSPLIKNLLKRGIIESNSLRIGFSLGQHQKGIYALGALLRADSWSQVTVPELRSQPGRVAREILGLPLMPKKTPNADFWKSGARV